MDLMAKFTKKADLTTLRNAPNVTNYIMFVTKMSLDFSVKIP